LSTPCSSVNATVDTSLDPSNAPKSKNTPTVMIIFNDPMTLPLADWLSREDGGSVAFCDSSTNPPTPKASPAATIPAPGNTVVDKTVARTGPIMNVNSSKTDSNE